MGTPALWTSSDLGNLSSLPFSSDFHHLQSGTSIKVNFKENELKFKMSLYIFFSFHFPKSSQQDLISNRYSVDKVLRNLEWILSQQLTLIFSRWRNEVFCLYPPPLKLPSYAYLLYKQNTLWIINLLSCNFFLCSQSRKSTYIIIVFVYHHRTNNLRKKFIM